MRPTVSKDIYVLYINQLFFPCVLIWMWNIHCQFHFTMWKNGERAHFSHFGTTWHIFRRKARQAGENCMEKESERERERRKKNPSWTLPIGILSFLYAQKLKLSDFFRAGLCTTILPGQLFVHSCSSAELPFQAWIASFSLYSIGVAVKEWTHLDNDIKYHILLIIMLNDFPISAVLEMTICQGSQLHQIQSLTNLTP